MSVDVFHGETIAENRRFPRKRMKLAIHYQCVEEDKNFKVETTSEDIGFGGAAIQGEVKMTVGQLVMLTIFIPPKEKYSQLQEYIVCKESECYPINALSRVAWCKANGEKKCILGLQFLHLVIEDRALLKTFASEFQLLTSDHTEFN